CPRLREATSIKNPGSFASKLTKRSGFLETPFTLTSLSNENENPFNRKMSAISRMLILSPYFLGFWRSATRGVKSGCCFKDFSKFPNQINQNAGQAALFKKNEKRECLTSKN